MIIHVVYLLHETSQDLEREWGRGEREREREREIERERERGNSIMVLEVFICSCYNTLIFVQREYFGTASLILPSSASSSGSKLCQQAHIIIISN